MPKRELLGIVKSNKCEKTVSVKVTRRVKHPKYKKYISTSKTYYAHDPLNLCEVGQTVNIRECRPMSRLKRWEVLYTQNNQEAIKQ